MRPLFGPRTAVEVAFLVAVPVIALEVGLGWPAIIGAGAIAYLLVLAVEAAIWREARRTPAQPSTPAPEQPATQAETVRVIRVEPVQVAPAPREPEPEPAPEPAAAAPREAPRLVSVPAPDPQPAPPAPEPALSPAASVVAISSRTAPRQWNVWDLERVSREHAGGDPVADEERTFLLMYLRDFAGPDGLLPVDFDDLVRQSFGSLVASL